MYNSFNDNQEIFKDSKPRILLTGRQRSGKTAINRVVFHKMSPNETLFLQSTSKIQKDSINHSSFVRFEVWEFPGQIDLLDSSVVDCEAIFSGCHALIYIIDSHDDYADSLDIMRAVVTRAYSVNPNMNFEIFIHKVDGLNDDHKIEIQRDIYHRAYDKLNQDDQSNINLSFSLTSIYDHSIFEAFSKVVQKLIPQLATLEQMLSIFVGNSGIEKAFLFDVVSKIYIATDASLVDMQTYELCCDMIDVVLDISGIYTREGLLDTSGGMDSGSGNSAMYDSTPPTMKSLNGGGPSPNIADDVTGGPNQTSTSVNGAAVLNGDGSSYDCQSSSVIKLTNGSVMVLKEVNKYLALVFIIRDDHYKQRAPLIDYNFFCFRNGIQRVFRASNEAIMAKKQLSKSAQNGGESSKPIDSNQQPLMINS